MMKKLAKQTSVTASKPLTSASAAIVGSTLANRSSANTARSRVNTGLARHQTHSINTNRDLNVVVQSTMSTSPSKARTVKKKVTSSATSLAYQKPQSIYPATQRKSQPRYDSPLKKSSTQTKIDSGLNTSSSPVLPYIMQSTSMIDRRGTERSMFMKKAGDERISCSVMIAVRSIRVDARIKCAEQRGPFAIQILRGPLRSETKEFYLPESAAIMPIDLVFQRSTTMYQLETNQFQKKIAQIRLLHLVNAPEDDRATSSMAKIVAELQLDLAQYVGAGLIQLDHQLVGEMAPPKAALECAINVSMQEHISPALDTTQKQFLFSTYRAGELNVTNNQDFSVDQSIQLLNESRFQSQKTLKQSESPCCDAKSQLKTSKAENETISTKISDLQIKLQAKTRENQDNQTKLKNFKTEHHNQVQSLQAKLEQALVPNPELGRLQKKEKELERLVSEKDGEFDEAIQEIDRMTEQITQLEGQVCEAQAQQIEAAQNAGDLDEKNEKVAALEEQVSELETQLELAQNDQREYVAQNDALENKVAKLEAQIEAKASEGADQVLQAQSTIDRLNKKIEEIQAQMKAQNEAKASEGADQVLQAQSTIDGLNRKIEEMQAQMKAQEEASKTDLAKAAEDKSQLESKMAALEKQIQASATSEQAGFETFQIQLGEVQGKLDQSNSLNAELRRQKESLESELVKLEGTLSSTKAEMESKTATTIAETVAATISAREKQIKLDHDAEKSAIVSEYKKKIQEVQLQAEQTKLDSTGELAAEKLELTKKVGGLEREKETLKKQVQEKDRYLEEAKSREDELQEEVEKYVKANDDLFTENDQLNQELDELRNEQISMLSQSNMSAGAAGDDNEAISHEKKKHATTQSLLSDYIKQVKTLEAENTALQAAKAKLEEDVRRLS